MSAFARKIAPWAVIAIAGGLVAGLLVAYPSLRRLIEGTSMPVVPATVVADAETVDGGNALQYAQALQANNCDEVIRLTGWMGDRLRRVALESSDPKNVEDARAKLCKMALARPYEDNVLRKEGIEDQFVFAPGATFEVVAKDKGRDDLGVAVGERIWIRVTYPRRETAPLAPVAETSPDMMPVRQWIVGVNLSRENKTVVKAAIQGNLELKRGSAVFDWPDREGE